MDPGQYAEAWREFSGRMDPQKYVKFAECFQRLIKGTNVNKAESMVTVGIGEIIYCYKFNHSDFVAFLVADLGFSKDGRVYPPVGAPTYKFAKISRKLHLPSPQSTSNVGLFFSLLKTGNAEFETIILEESLPNINHVIAVEPDVKFNDKITKALNPPGGRSIKVSKSTRCQDNQSE